jgi:hypothetical protein
MGRSVVGCAVVASFSRDERLDPFQISLRGLCPVLEERA